MKKIIFLFNLMFACGACAEGDLKIQNYLQGYIENLMQKNFKKINHDDFFKGQFENDLLMYKKCKTQKCQVKILDETRTVKIGDKTTYFAFIQINDKNSSMLYKPDGCYVVYTNDSGELTFSAYDNHCSED